jgi:hypothetical protein
VQEVAFDSVDHYVIRVSVSKPQNVRSHTVASARLRKVCS